MSLSLGGRLALRHAPGAGGWSRSPTTQGAVNTGIFQLCWSIRHWWLSADLQPLWNSNGPVLHLAVCEGCRVLATNFTIDQKSSLSIKLEVSSNGKQFWKGQGRVFICATSAFKQQRGPLCPLTVVRKFKIFLIIFFSLSPPPPPCIFSKPLGIFPVPKRIRLRGNVPGCHGDSVCKQLPQSALTPGSQVCHSNA